MFLLNIGCSGGLESLCTSGTFQSYGLNSEAEQVNSASGCPRLSQARDLLEEQPSTAFVDAKHVYTDAHRLVETAAQSNVVLLPGRLVKLDSPHYSCMEDFSKYKSVWICRKAVRLQEHIFLQIEISVWVYVKTRKFVSQSKTRPCGRAKTCLIDTSDSHRTWLHLLGQGSLKLQQACMCGDFGVLMWFPAWLHPASSWAEVWSVISKRVTENRVCRVLTSTQRTDGCVLTSGHPHQLCNTEDSWFDETVFQVNCGHRGRKSFSHHQAYDLFNTVVPIIM